MQSQEPPSPEEVPRLDSKEGECLDLAVPPEGDYSLNPVVLNPSPRAQCGIKSTYMGSYWSMVSTKKDGENPLRSKKVVDAPESRSLGSCVLDASIDDLSVFVRESVNPRI